MVLWGSSALHGSGVRCSMSSAFHRCSHSNGCRPVQNHSDAVPVPTLWIYIEVTQAGVQSRSEGAYVWGEARGKYFGLWARLLSSSATALLVNLELRAC